METKFDCVHRVVCYVCQETKFYTDITNEQTIICKPCSEKIGKLINENLNLSGVLAGEIVGIYENESGKYTARVIKGGTRLTKN